MCRADHSAGPEAPLTIETATHGHVTVLALTGALSFPEGTALLRGRSRELVAGGARRLVFDLTAVPWIDSCGLGEIVACYKRAREVGGEVKLVLQNLPHRQFTYCHLDRMFEIYPDAPAALAGFGG